MSNKDKRYEKTEYLIKRTFFDMVKSNEKITVSGISQRANIDRKTFYLHYPSIESLYESFIKDAELLMIEELDRLDYIHSKDHIKTYMQAYREIFISHKDIYYAINANKNFLEFQNTSNSLLSSYLNREKKQKDIDHETYYNIFVSDGFSRFQQRFIQGELNLTIDEYFEEIEKIFRSFATLYAKRSK